MPTRRSMLLGLGACGISAVAARGMAPPLANILGDGKTDNTAALQQAIDAAQGGVRFPAGVFRITKSLEVSLDKVGFTSFSADGNAVLFMDGPGPAIHFVGTHGGTAAPESVKPEVWHRQRTPRVEGLEIVGNHPEADGIRAEGTMQLTVLGTTIRKCRHGIHLVKRNRNVLISACHIYENRGIGVFFDRVNLHQTNIVGSHISYCGGGGIVTRGGEVRNIHIGTCDIEGNMTKDGPATANVLIDCTDGSTAEVAITGCTIQHSNVSDSANIRILGAGAGIKKETAAYWGHVTIGDNVFSDVAVNVDLRDCRGVTMTGNTFWMGYRFNLKAVNCEQIVVGPNAFERNPAYDYGTSKETKNAIHFENCRDSTLTGLHVHGVRAEPAAVVLDRCSRFNVTNCTILDCEGISLLLNEPKNCRVSDCLIRNDTPEGKNAVPLKVVGGSGTETADNSLGK